MSRVKKLLYSSEINTYEDSYSALLEEQTAKEQEERQILTEACSAEKLLVEAFMASAIENITLDDFRQLSEAIAICARKVDSSEALAALINAAIDVSKE